MHEHIWKDEEEESEVSSEAARGEEELDSEGEESGEVEDNIIGVSEARRRWDDSEKCNEEEIKKVSSKTTREEINDLHNRLNLNDTDSTPQMNEVMNQFFSRTAKYWMTLDLENLEREIAARGGVRGEFSEKEVRRRAFKLAEARYMELQPMLERLDKLERQQLDMEDSRANRDSGSGSQRRRIKEGRK